MTAYYNEIDPYAAEWLQNLIQAGLIAPGDIDQRSIADVKASDLLGYDQCHFFAGIGGWSYALRLAGWDDERPVWTGSCPCQPFSQAGAQRGFDDARHLWPVWFRLIEKRRPAVVFGEQVASALAWFDLVQTDLEGEGYAVGAADLCAAGVGAPHIRQRLWFVADAGGDRRDEQRRFDRSQESSRKRRGEPDDGCNTGNLADSECSGSDAGRPSGEGWRSPLEPDRYGSTGGGLGDAGLTGLSQRERDGRFQSEALGSPSGQAAVGGGDAGQLGDAPSDGRIERRPEPDGRGAVSAWSDADWLPCRDGKARPVEPGTFPLAHGVSARVGRLRAYGNAIVPQVAAEFIKAAMPSIAEHPPER